MVSYLIYDQLFVVDWAKMHVNHGWLNMVKRWECVMGVPSASPSHILCFTGKKRLVKYVEVLLSTFTNQ